MRNHPVHDRAHPSLNGGAQAPRKRLGFQGSPHQNRKHAQAEEHSKNPSRTRDSVHLAKIDSNIHRGRHK